MFLQASVFLSTFGGGGAGGGYLVRGGECLTVNRWAVRILLECILLDSADVSSGSFTALLLQSVCHAIKDKRGWLKSNAQVCVKENVAENMQVRWSCHLA